MTSSDGAPEVSFLLPHLPDEVRVLAILDSLRAQKVRRWELVVVVSAESVAALAAVAGADSRVRVVEAPVAAGTAARAALALDSSRGEVFARVRHDDRLSPTAVRRVLDALSDEGVVAVYGDEEVVGRRGKVVRRLQPAWSPERLRAQDYLGYPVFFRTAVARASGGYRADLGDAADYDLTLRVGEQPGRIVALPQVLCRRRADGSSVEDGTLTTRAVQDQLDRLGLAGDVTPDTSGRHRIHRHLPPERSVSIIVPTSGASGTLWGRSAVLVVEAVRTALIHTEHEDLEIVVVADASTPPQVVDELRSMAGDRLTLVWFRESFNFARKINFGALASRGDRLVLLNDDTQVRTLAWLDELIAPLEEPDLGVSGARLLYSNGSVQHAGLASVPAGGYVHPFRTAGADEAGDDEMLLVSREVSAVTGACLAVRRDVFFEVGGLCEQLPLGYNDVDFCLKARACGYRVALMRNCELFHFESMSRPPRVEQWEIDAIVRRWGKTDRDPFTPRFPSPDLAPA